MSLDVDWWNFDTRADEGCMRGRLDPWTRAKAKAGVCYPRPGDVIE